MIKKKIIFSLSLVPTILIIVGFFASISLVNYLFASFEIGPFLFFLLIVWFLIIFIQQSYFLISEDSILFPIEYFKKNNQIRLFKKRVMLKPLDIKSIDYDDSYYDVDGGKSNISNFFISNMSGVNRVHKPQLLVIELISGKKKKFALKIYTKNSVKRFIESITEINEDIFLSKEIRKELDL